MKPDSWPFRPLHITNDGESQYDSPDLRKLTGVGIIPYKYLQGMQTSACANLGNPTTIFEFSPEGIPVRSDSVLAHYDLHPPCRKFRGSDHRFCHMVDNTHAMLFCGLTRWDLAKDIRRRLKKHGLAKLHRQDEGSVCRLARRDETEFLEYDCPFLGYRELLFPVFFEDRVIATLLVSEICLEKKLDLIERRQACLLSELSSWATHHSVSGHLAGDPEAVAKSVRQLHAEWVSDTEHVLDDSKYDRLVEKALAEIYEMEEHLSVQMELQRERYVREHLDRYVREFHDGVARIVSASDDGLRMLWTNVCERLSSIVLDFDLLYVATYGIRRLSTDRHRTLELVASAGDLPTVFQERSPLTEYDLSQVPPDALQRPTTSRDHPELFEGLSSIMHALQVENALICAFPVPFLAEGSTVVLVGYKPGDPSTSTENQRGGYVETSLNAFYSIVSSSVSSILAAAAEAYLDTSLRIFGHEAGQLVSGLDWLRQVYLSRPDQLRALSRNKAGDICADIQGFINQLHFLTVNAKMLMRTPVLDPTRFLPYKELIFKWKDIYRLEADAKSLRFSTADPTAEPWSKRPPMFGDKRYLEQLLYNLVNNAVKYCHRGTIIHLDCQAQEEVGGRYTLTITDYGVAAPDEHYIYELYRHGENVEHEEGLGIGLYLAKRIAQAHGGAIWHDSIRVSSYNVPLMEAYIATDFEDKDAQLEKSIESELKRLRRTGEYHRIVAVETNGRLKYATPTTGELLDCICLPTYRVTFRVTMPSGVIA